MLITFNAVTNTNVYLYSNDEATSQVLDSTATLFPADQLVTVGETYSIAPSTGFLIIAVPIED